MEDIFFFQYHLKMDRETCLRIPVNERKWLTQRFINQKNSEHEAFEAERRKGKK